MTKYVAQANKFADAVQALVEVRPTVWGEATLREKGYPFAKAGAVMEDTGLGADTDTSVVFDSGYGSWHRLVGIETVPGVHAEPYASWLLLFYED